MISSPSIFCFGFTQAIIPRANQPKQKIDGLEIIAVERVADAIARFRV